MKAMRRLPVWFGALLVVGLLVAGLHSLISLRFRSGDIYPDYSTYRAGPRGTKILYRALKESPGVRVERLLKSWDMSEKGQDVSVMMLGSNQGVLHGGFHDDWASFLHSGGRLVVALSPGGMGAFWNDEPLAEDGEQSEEETDTDEADDVSTVVERTPEPELAGIEIASLTTNELNALDARYLAVSETDGESVPWMGMRYFKDPGPDWTVLYRFNGNPVVVERSWSRGTLVLLSDSYLFSNEAMVLDRHTPVLLDLIGPARRIVFSERHLGVVSQEGIMMLAARYRMRGVLVALLALAGLFVWQRTSSFIPRYEDEVGEDNTVGAWVGSGEGFTNLLLRYIPPKQILPTMVDEWEHTFGNHPTMKSKAKKLRETFNGIEKEEGKARPVAQYNRLVDALNERK